VALQFRNEDAALAFEPVPEVRLWSGVCNRHFA
jgi:hypothetical protein